MDPADHRGGGHRLVAGAAGSGVIDHYAGRAPISRGAAVTVLLIALVRVLPDKERAVAEGGALPIER